MSAASSPKSENPSRDRLRLTGRVLVVDDNQVNLLVMRGLLAAYGLEVIESGSGEEALHLLFDEDFDLVVLDCHMPDRDGFSVAKAYRMTKSSGIPIIAHSADWSELNQRLCQESGMNAFLPKPCTRPRLEEMLCRYMRTA